MAGRPDTDGPRDFGLGAIMLPVMACAVAAVLFATERNEHIDPAAEKAYAEATNAVSALARERFEAVSNRLATAMAERREEQQKRAELDRAVKECDALSREAETLSRRLELAKQHVKFLETSLQDHQKAQARARQREDFLRHQLVAMSNRVEKLNQWLADKQEEFRDVSTAVEIEGMDTVPRPFISIDCLRDRAIIHPPHAPPREVAGTLQDADRKWLEGVIASHKAVVVFARASSFDNSFRYMHTLVEAFTKRDDGLSRTYVPVEDKDNIKGHIRLGGGRL